MRWIFVLLPLAMGVEAGLIKLSFWQYSRYQQRVAEQQEFNSGSSQTFTGIFINSQTVALENQPHPSQPDLVGWRIFTPFQTSNTIMIVDRGWTSTGPQPEFSMFDTSTTKITGILQPFPHRRGWLQGPTTTTNPHLLAFLDPTAITSANASENYLIATTRTSEHILTAPPPLFNPLRHLSYAWQWASMAVVFPLLCGFAGFRNRPRRRRS